ncbi:MAG: WXG100 family type VII secretion target [Actinomycetaceae bacterium]|nr:WXG100 family type VII secretion target [Actinomycetaceae bacterium]
MPIFTVDSERLSQSAGQIAATAERIRAEVATMTSDLLEMQDTWTGGAQISFAECFAQWQASQVQMDAALDSIGMALSSASEAYTSAETQSASFFAG